MNRWTTALVMVLGLGLLLPSFAAEGARQQDEDDYEWKTWRTKRSHAGFNGHGGFFFGAQTITSNDLDNLAASMGLDDFDGVTWGWGGYGLGHIGGGWRIGGLGFGAMAQSSGVFTDTSGSRYNRELQLDLGGGGFVVEYSPWMLGPVHMGLGAMIGGGGVTVSMRQDSGTYTWDELKGQYVGSPSKGENITTELTRPFFIAQPYVTVRVHILDWMAAEGQVGYTISSLTDSGWYFDDEEINGAGPSIDVNKPFFRVGLIFGG